MDDLTILGSDLMHLPQALQHLAPDWASRSLLSGRTFPHPLTLRTFRPWPAPCGLPYSCRCRVREARGSTPGRKGRRAMPETIAAEVRRSENGRWQRVPCGAGRSLEVVTGGHPRRDAADLPQRQPDGCAVVPPLAVAQHHGLSLVTWSRPGYAGSTPQQGRLVADVAANAAAVLDATGADSVLTLGWSASRTWLSERIPGAIAHLNADQGHLSLGVAQVAEIVGDLLAAGSAADCGSLERAGR